MSSSAAHVAQDRSTSSVTRLPASIVARCDRSDTPGGTLELDLRLGIGRIDVRRFSFLGFETTLGGAKQSQHPRCKENP
jgi:hypothetical protein